MVLTAVLTAEGMAARMAVSLERLDHRVGTRAVDTVARAELRVARLEEDSAEGMAGDGED